MELNEKISALRKSNNMTQAELGTKLNVTFQAVSKWERGESYPDFETLSKMARIFGVPISYFEEGGENFAESAETAATGATAADGFDGSNVVGFCKDCGKLVRTGEEACTAPVVICKQCALRRENIRRIEENNREIQKQQAERAVKAKKQAELDGCKRRRNRGLIASAFISAALLVLFIILAATATDAVPYIVLIVMTAAFGYTFFAQLFWDGIVVDLALCGGKVVGMPGVIFTLDLDGLKFLIIVKILFALIKLFIFIVTFLFMVLVAMFASPFTFVPQMIKLGKGMEL
ncbi:MAG: helix-turn-helix transcriptional regulator [Clostridiales bacterium]|nr:helix-turn-helix transcriptional regulator [Clostridiales bacterium]